MPLGKPIAQPAGTPTAWLSQRSRQPRFPKSERVSWTAQPVLGWWTVLAMLLAWCGSVPLSVAYFAVPNDSPAWLDHWLVTLPTIISLPPLLWFSMEGARSTADSWARGRRRLSCADLPSNRLDALPALRWGLGRSFRRNYAVADQGRDVDGEGTAPGMSSNFDFIKAEWPQIHPTACARRATSPRTRARRASTPAGRPSSWSDYLRRRRAAGAVQGRPVGADQRGGVPQPGRRRASRRS